MKKVAFVTVTVFATVFVLMAVNHIVTLTQAGLIHWDR